MEKTPQTPFEEGAIKGLDDKHADEGVSPNPFPLHTTERSQWWTGYALGKKLRAEALWTIQRESLLMQMSGSTS